MKQKEDHAYNKQQIRDWLIEQLAQLIYLDPGEIDPNQTFESYGLSSREAVMLSGDLEEWLGRRLEPTLAWKYPTIEALAEYLAESPEDVIAEQASTPLDTIPPKDLTNMPIAIIGIGCRFPGANGPEEFWQLLRDGVDAITEVPPDRWDIGKYYDPDPTKPGKMVTKWGGFLDGVDLFDNDFFRISPREAVRMDPQQRLLLEVTWEALEDAGQAVDALSGSRTGVFIGISSMDYSQFQFTENALIDAYAGTGSALSIAANRLSFFLNLHGPSIAVDTACSSSLVAVHQACHSLRDDECDLALVGGVNLILTPEISITFTKAGILSPDGRSRAFDAGANGYVRGEGAGIVVLKPLSKALDDHDRIYAVILGSAVNHDGRSNGLMAPNPKAQEDLLRRAYIRAGVSPGSVQYVEAHGTGTQLGDPIEAGALGAVLAEDRIPGERCAIGSVKSNIGHLEAAAGIAGLIKVALSLKERLIPPSMHYHQPNPYINFEELSLRVQDELTDWLVPSGVRLAGVSSFGFGGTNAHAVLTESPPVQRIPENPDSSIKAHLLPLSARSPETLIELARAHREKLTNDTYGPKSALRDIAYSASVRRSHLEYRLAVLGRTSQEITANLDAYLTESKQINLAEIQQRIDEQRRLVFVFSGQGSQWMGMGNELLEGEATFRDALKQCDHAIRAFVDWSVIDMLTRDDLQDRLTDIAVLQPVLFSIQVALAALWRSWGIEPDAVVGHSLGEVGAAYTAGILDLEDAARIVVERSRLMQRVSGQGAMLVVGLSELHARQTIAGYEDRVSIAVMNSPQSVVLSGDPKALQEVANKLDDQTIFHRFVEVDVAAHSPQMDSLPSELVEILSGLQAGSGSLPFYSSVEGCLVDGTALDENYWGRNLREPVRFSDAIGDLSGEGNNVYLEISPHPVLLSSIQQCLHHLGLEGLTIPSLRRDVGERDGLLRSLGRLYTSGYSVDWRRLFTSGGNFVALPNYPWQRKRYWLEQWGKPTTGISFSQKRVSEIQDSFSEIPEDRLYEISWQLQERQSIERDIPEIDGSWLIFSDSKGVGEALVSRMEAIGIQCIRVFPGRVPNFTNEDIIIRPEETEDFSRLVEYALGFNGTGISGVVHLWSLDAPKPEEMQINGLEDAQRLGVGSILHTIQALNNVNGIKLPRMSLVTQGTHHLEEVPVPLSPPQSPVWGLGRTVAQEQPVSKCVLIDLSPLDRISSSAEYLLDEILNPDEEDQIVFRGGKRYVARFSKRTDGYDRRTKLEFRENASYLITGGLGGLGLELARWLVKQGARRLILIGRTKLPPRDQWNIVEVDNPTKAKIQAIREFESMGIDIHYSSVDVANESQVQRILDKYRQEGWPPIRGVFHLAGVVNKQTLQEIHDAELNDVMRPKIIGAWLLHRLLEHDSLDFFVLFSSAAALLGSPLLASYAAANAFLDGLAHFRRSQGLSGLSINWGSWSDTGMAHRFLEEQGRELTPRGMGSFSPSQGLNILHYLLQQKDSQTCVLNVNWDEWCQFHPTAAKSPMLSNLLSHTLKESTLTDKDNQVGDDISLVHILQITPDERREVLLVYLQKQIGSILHIDAATIPPGRNLADLGLDSLMAMELIRRMELDLQIRVFPREIFERPTIIELATYLAKEIGNTQTLAQGSQASNHTLGATAFTPDALTFISPKAMSEPILETQRRNPSALFLLSSPRAGSTLLRVMLAGHPDLFSPPELHLLPFNNMQQRQESLGLTYLDEGLQRALMDLKGIGAEESLALVEDWIKRDMPIQEVYGVLQSLANGRMLIDKSPSYGASEETLKRAEVLFDKPKYIHLVRHPYAAIESTVRIRLDKLLGAMDTNPYAIAEQVWTTMNSNILILSEAVDSDRYLRVRFEDLVHYPEKVTRQICSFLEVRFDEAILAPYEGKRMTDGLHSASLSIGDPNFLKHKGIDSSLADKWMKINLPNRLNQETIRIADELGYKLPLETQALSSASEIPALVPIQPEGSLPPFFMIHPGSGLVYFYYQFGQLLGHEQPFYAIQDPSLSRHRQPHECIEDYAKEYVQAIRTIQAEGPYRIGGWSFGGQVAFEMAHLLRSSGQKVDLMVLLDTEAPLAGRAINLRQRLRYWKNRTLEFLTFLLDVAPYVRDGFYLLVIRDKLGYDHPGRNMSRLGYIQWVWADAMHRRLARRAGMTQLISKDASFLRMRIPTVRRVLYVLSHHIRVVQKYRPKIYLGDIVLLRATEQVKRQFFDDETLGWDELVEGNVDVQPIPGNHVTMFKEPYISAVAETLRRCVEKAEAKKSESLRSIEG